MMEEIKKEELGNPDLGQATSPNLGQAGNPIKKETKIEPDNGKLKPETPPTDFKIAEIWIRSGQLMLDATPEFWRDKFRARGVIAYLDDIVREAKLPVENKIIPVKGSMMNFARNLFKRKR